MKRLFLLTVFCAAMGALVVHNSWQWWHQPGPSQTDTLLLISSGSSLASVAAKLEATHVLERAELWRWIARAKGLDVKIRRGEYQLPAAIAPGDILKLITAGDVVLYSVTLPEGINLRQAIAIMHEDPVLEAQLSGEKDPLLADLVHPYTHPEGLFFPDTYYFSRGDTDFDVLAVAHERMLEQLEAAWMDREEGLPYDDAYDALIMASVIEKETGVAAERERIAGVFVRRLQKRMRLQTDPTIIYGLGARFDGNLTRRHLEDSSNPYNTYRQRGLPPSPIALPGRAALNAAVNPASGTELYFVARGDGSHQFSDTLDQHINAVRQWQKRRVKNYRSAPEAAQTKNGKS